ncbi:hypothetical protein HMPREF9582_00439 [Cutibacterium acnes HL060PA1]|nr:hypothetical protein HMPREF9582_00439 [Cutibacterium acnes HL060PA1]
MSCPSCIRCRSRGGRCRGGCQTWLLQLHRSFACSSGRQLG